APALELQCRVGTCMSSRGVEVGGAPRHRHASAAQSEPVGARGRRKRRGYDPTAAETVVKAVSSDAVGTTYRYPYGADVSPASTSARTVCCSSSVTVAVNNQPAASSPSVRAWPVRRLVAAGW